MHVASSALPIPFPPSYLFRRCKIGFVLFYAQEFYRTLDKAESPLRSGLLVVLLMIEKTPFRIVLAVLRVRSRAHFIDEAKLLLYHNKELLGCEYSIHFYELTGNRGPFVMYRGKGPGQSYPRSPRFSV